MKAKKYSLKDARLVDLETKKIYKYPSQTRLLELSLMRVNGRHPKKKNQFILEHDTAFFIYVLKGKGKVYAGEEIFKVKPGDVVFVPTKTKFAVEGNFEYLTAQTPAFYPEQSELIEE